MSNPRPDRSGLPGATAKAGNFLLSNPASFGLIQGDPMNRDAETSAESDRTEAFLRLITEHERRLAIYVTGLVVCPQDAQDVLQEGKIVMWRQFHQFELGTNFAAWARKILFYQILAFRRRCKRDRSEFLSDRLLETLSEESESAIKEQRWQKREKALQECVTKLSGEHREILELRYRDEASIEGISRRTERTEGAVYRLLSRLRKNLHQCVEKELSQA
jgi:RNA polymerase sigma-70 factor (ECF subfamily)